MFPLVGLAASSLAAMLYVSKKKKAAEGYANADIPIAAQTKAIFDADGLRLIQDNAANYSRIMNVINKDTNPNFQNDRSIQNLETVLQGALPRVSRRGTKTAVVSEAFTSIQAGVNPDVILPSVENTVGDYIKRCETYAGTDVKGFDDAWFASHCGICHDGGTKNDSTVHIGGLYFDHASQPLVKADATRRGLRYPDYQPSAGTCASGKFSVSKADAERIIKRVECEKKQNYDVDGCAQCVADERFYYISSDTAKEPISIVVAGVGSLALSSGGKVANVTLSKNPQTITPEIPLKEGDVAYMAVVGPSETVKPEISAYIYAKTITGEYRMDIVRLADVDLETGVKPRFAGISEMNKEFYNILRTGSQKSKINLQVNIPYTYIEPNELEAQQCGSAPFLTTAGSAVKLSSGPCFVKGSKPGNYSLECIQQIFDSAGCGPAGKGYPTTLEQARTWAKNDTIGILAGNVYGAAVRADSGIDGGRKLTLPERHESAQFCNGRSYLTPCDQYDKEKGPLGDDCIEYLYKQETEAGRCRPTGSAAPTTQKSIAAAQAAGGVEAVKEYYRSIYARATNNALKDKDREAAMKQCFDIEYIYSPVPGPQPVVRGSVLTNPSANQASSYKRISNSYPPGISPVAVLGPYGMAPWGSAAKFSDTTAKWIWNTFNADKDAPIFNDIETPGQDRNKPAFFYLYNNKESSIVNARVDFMVDNIGDLYVNGELIAAGHTGGWGGDWRATAGSIGNQKNIRLIPGQNLIKFVANNMGGPAGFMMACFGPDGKLLFHTDSSWVFRDLYSKIGGATVTDLDSIGVHQTSVVANVVKTDRGNEMWNPYNSAGHTAPIVYRLQVDFGRPVQLKYIIALTTGDTAHDPTAVRIYTDSGKGALLGSYGSLERRTETRIDVVSTAPRVSSVYIEIEKSTAYQIWLRRLFFVEVV